MNKNKILAAVLTVSLAVAPLMHESVFLSSDTSPTVFAESGTTDSIT